jgi:hypothetical protein
LTFGDALVRGVLVQQIVDRLIWQLRGDGDSSTCAVAGLSLVASRGAASIIELEFDAAVLLKIRAD